MVPIAEGSGYGGKPWTVEGDMFENYTFQPSILHKTSYADGIGEIPRECESHFFVRNGAIEMC